MDKEFQELLAKLNARDEELKALVAKANEEAKLAGGGRRHQGRDRGHRRAEHRDPRPPARDRAEAGAPHRPRGLGRQDRGRAVRRDDSFKKLATERRGTARMAFKGLGLNAAVNNVTSTTAGAAAPATASRRIAWPASSPRPNGG
jgi:hypothetical protein